MRVAMVPAGDRPTQNPSVVQLAEALPAHGVTVERPRSRPRRGSVDVLHHHWPSADGQWGSAPAAALRLGRTLGVVAAHRAAGARIVWTAHNVVAHERRHPRVERLFWRAYVRLLDGCVVLTGASEEVLLSAHPKLADVPRAVIPIGHMVGVVGPPVDKAEARAALEVDEDRRVIAHVGRIRPYKGVPALVSAFATLGADDTTLLLGGDVGDPEVGPAVDRARAAGADIRFTPRRLEDAEAARLLGAADVVVYPFARVMNSGAVVLALSYGRPVLAASSPSLVELQAAVGPERLRLLAGPLRPGDLAAALDAAPAGTGPPPTAALGEWPAIAAATVALYERAGARG